MPTRLFPRAVRSIPLAALAALAACAGVTTGSPSQRSTTRTPLRYVITIPAPATKTFDVQVVVPAEGHDSVSLMMPIWSPGMYALQSYGDRITAFSARSLDGTALSV